MLDETRVVELLDSTEIFANFSKKHLAAIAKACKVVKYEARSRIVTQGEPGGELYIVASGQVSVVLEDQQLGIEQSVLKLGPGQSFGEVSLLARSPRSATVKAGTDVYCVVLAQASFESVLRQIPEVGIAISRYLAARLHHQCQLTGFRFVSLSDMVHDPELQALFPDGLLTRLKAVPLELREGTLTVALTKPNEINHIKALRDAAPGVAIEPVACTGQDYESYRERFDSDERAVRKLAVQPGTAKFKLDSGMELRDPLNGLILEAVQRRHTHIVIEVNPGESLVLDPSSSSLEPLFKVEGPEVSTHLREQLLEAFFPGEQPPVVSHGTLTLGNVRCAVQLSKLQTLRGPRFSLRLSDSKGSLPLLRSLIPLDTLRDCLVRSLNTIGNGVLLAGTPRSGRTTTAYSLLSTLVQDYGLDNVLTLEKNPVVNLPAIGQVRAVDGWQPLLEAALLQFPRLLFVDDVNTSELPDLLQCLDGRHTTFVCFDSGEPLDDLLEALAGSEQAFVNLNHLDILCHQKSLLRQCSHCRQEHEPSAAVLSRLSREKLIEPGQLFFSSVGCNQCRGTGISGHSVVLEAIVFNAFLREMMEAGRPPEAIRKAARDNGLFFPFQASARILLNQGDLLATDVLRYFGTRR